MVHGINTPSETTTNERGFTYSLTHDRARARAAGTTNNVGLDVDLMHGLLRSTSGAGGEDEASRALEILNARAVDVDDATLAMMVPGARRASVKPSRFEKALMMPMTAGPPMMATMYDGGDGVRARSAAPTSRADHAMAVNNEGLAFDDDDDDELAHIDVDEIVKQRQRPVEAAPAPVAMAMMPMAASAPARVAPEPSRVTMGNGQAPPLDGSGADWLCEHGASLRECPNRAAHVDALRPVLDHLVFQLEDDDVVLKNSDRKLLQRQRVEAETIVRVCTGANRPSIPAMPSQMNYSGQEYRPIPNMGNAMGTNMSASAPMTRQFSEPSSYAAGPPMNERYSFATGAQAQNLNEFASWDQDDFQIDDAQPVIPMNGIGTVNASANIKPMECQIKCGDAAEWGRSDYQWSNLCQTTLRNTFNARDFRGLQLQTINATMAGKDCLVLMPTGGGKSLCYQLPAVIKPGITVVISPLISLIQDQLHHLGEMQIPATVLSAAKESDDVIYQDLNSATPELRLLYVTPEKVVRSGKLKSTLQRLYDRGMLSRFVLDEAHCISSWGHDFRKDYTELRGLKYLFPTTPIMCLTATATRRVQDDIVHQLNLPKCLRFFDTFNRTNLTYLVQPKLKGKQMVRTIKDLILKHGLVKNGRVQSGIVYCFSQIDCENLAQQLSKMDRDMGDYKNFPRRLSAKPYHAGLSNSERKRNQEMWARDEVQIICATVAFGMGINKPNVRFVFHHSMPKSLEAYHQESGRAGRDGEHGLCILFYSWGDASKARSMIIDSSRRERAHPAVLTNNLESLNTMVSYCENLADCRRTQLMGHFDERFDRAQCRGMCDSCQAIARGVKFEPVDVTNYALGLLNITKATPEGIGMGLLVDVFRGSAAKAVTQKQYNRLPGYGSGKALDKSEAERLARAMVLRGYLTERSVRSENGGPFATTVTTVHFNKDRAQRMQNGQEVFTMPFEKKESSNRKAPVPTVVQMPAIGTQPGTQPNVDDFLEDFLNPEAVAGKRKEEEMCQRVFDALFEWRSRTVDVLNMKDGRGLGEGQLAPIDVNTVCSTGLMDKLKVERPCSKEAIDAFSQKLENARERTMLKNYGMAGMIDVIKQAVDCGEKDIPNPYLEENRKQEEADEEGYQPDLFDDSLMHRRKSMRLSQEVAEPSDNPSPAWTKARRDSSSH
jgi:RecQ family ATP-dependent DNA helicase